METDNRRSPVTAGAFAQLAIAWLTMFVIGSDLFVVSPLLPLISADYAVDPASAGLSVTVFAVTYMLSAPALGQLADRVGRGRVLTCCLCAFAAANLLAALAALSLVLAWANNRVWHASPTAKSPAAPAHRLTVTVLAARLAPTVLWSTALYAMYTYLGEGLSASGDSTGQIAEAIVFYGCGAIAGTLIGGRAADRLGARLTISIGLSGFSS